MTRSPAIQQQLEKLSYCGHDRQMTPEQRIAHDALSRIQQLVNECDEFRETCAECRSRFTTHKDAYALGLQTQRARDAKYMQHKDGCKAGVCAVVTKTRGLCGALPEAFIHQAPRNLLHTYRHAFISTDCTCGLAAAIRQED